MTYSRYLSYDIFGGIFWVCAMILGGYLLGATVPNIGNQIHWVISIVIFLSILPAIIHAWRIRAQERAAARTGQPLQPH